MLIDKMFKHPGDGICDQYLYNYYNKDITELFEHYHYTDLPFEILENAKKNKFKIVSLPTKNDTCQK